MGYKIDVNKNPRVKALLQQAVGKEANLDNYSVFEFRANDTLPITKAGGMLKNGSMTSNYLQQMASVVNQGSYVPVIQLHNQDESLPIGRIIDAKVYDTPNQYGQADLHILAYLNADSEDAKNLDNGIINEISTGSSPSKVVCSECGYNFFENNSTRRNLYAGENYDPLCANGHQWDGVNVTLKLDGLKDWRETSLVTRGAVPRAQVLLESDQRLSQETEQINLSSDGDEVILFSTIAGVDFFAKQREKYIQANPKNPKTGGSMPDITLAQDKYNALIIAEANLTAAKTEADNAKTALAAAQAAEATAKADLAAKEAELTAKDAELTQVKADLTAKEAELAVALTGAGNKGKGAGEGANTPDQNNQVFQLPNSCYQAGR